MKPSICNKFYFSVVFNDFANIKINQTLQTKFLYLDLVKLDTVKNLITLQIKYYIYSMRCSNNNIHLNGLISSIKSLYETSKHIALKNDKQEPFDKAWIEALWSNLFD